MLILEDSELPGYRRSPRYYDALSGLFPAIDILVYTPEEVHEWSGVPNAFETVAMRKGRVLYGDTALTRREDGCRRARRNRRINWQGFAPRPRVNPLRK